MNSLFTMGKAVLECKIPLQVFLLICLMTSSGLTAQLVNSKALSLKECLDMAYDKNENLKVADLQYQYYNRHKKALFEIPKTSLIYTQGQFNSIYPYDNIIALTQVVPFPTYFKAQAQFGKAQIKGAEIKKEASKAELTYRVKEVYYKLQHLMQESFILAKEDSIYEIFLKMNKGDVKGDTKTELEEATTITKAHLIQNAYNRILQEVNDNRIQLQYLLRTENLPEVQAMTEEQRILSPDTSISLLENQPQLRYLQEQIELNKRQRIVDQQKTIPDLHFSYFNQSIYGPANIYGDNYFLTTSDRLQGFQLGLIFPLYFGPSRAKVQAGRVQEQLAEEEYLLAKRDMEGQFKQAVNKYLLNRKNLEYYKEYILIDSRKMIVKSLDAYNNKDINYIEYLTIIDGSFGNIRDYLHMVLENNMAVIQLEYFLNKEGQ